MQAGGTDYGSRGDNSSSEGSRSVGLDEAGSSRTSQIGEIIFLNSRAEPPSQVPEWLESGSGNLTKRTASLELSPADDIYLLPNSTRLNKDKSRLINNRANAVTKEKVAENIGSQLRWKWLFSDPIKGLFWSQWILGYGNPTDHFKLLSKLNVQDGLVEY